MVGSMALSLSIRPSEMVAYRGSVLERLLFDAKVLAEASKHISPKGKSTEDKIMARRHAAGGYT